MDFEENKEIPARVYIPYAEWQANPQIILDHHPATELVILGENGEPAMYIVRQVEPLSDD